MLVPRELVKFEQDSEILEMNIANVTNELSEMVMGDSAQPTQIVPSTRSYGTNFGMADRLLLSSPSRDYTHFLTVNELRLAFESFYLSKVGTKESNVGAYAEFPMSDQSKTGARKKRRDIVVEADPHMALLCVAIDENTSHPNYFCTESTRNPRRRYPRPVVDHEPTDYESVVIDLSAIGLNAGNEETNDVLRLFGVFRKLHYYLNDVLPTEPEPDLTDYPDQFVKPSPLMPCTMNVQRQIKYAIHKCYVFSHHLLEKLDKFKLADRQKYLECSYSVYVLRKIIKQLVQFKDAEFDHRQGIFVNTFGAAQAKNLEILLTQIISKIRECNIYVEVYVWSAKQSMQNVDMPSVEILQKAVAIAGALLNKKSTLSLEDKDEKEEDEKETFADLKTKEVFPENNGTNNNEGGNGGGFAHSAIIPGPPLNAHAMRYIGV